MAKHDSYTNITSIAAVKKFFICFHLSFAFQIPYLIPYNVYIFVFSRYPLILSLENHCSVDQQVVMAKHLVNILGGEHYVSAKLHPILFKMKKVSRRYG